MLGQLLALHEKNPHGTIALSNPLTGAKPVCNTSIASVKPVGDTVARPGSTVQITVNDAWYDAMDLSSGVFLNDTKLVNGGDSKVYLHYLSGRGTAQYVMEFRIPDDFDLPDHPGTVDITVEVAGYADRSTVSFTKSSALSMEWPNSASASAGSTQQ
ncbi:hypothetical protein [Streptomyces canus]|uniref:hypothetical protein n=1 Tax=Streptomyces canus TaxID=58343 RepID=UPI002E2BB84C|nr:hypothetical protein [Streptomyces canus]